MRYHNITKDDMLNGEGLRVVLWVSGCSHGCSECHNPITWSAEDGVLFDEAAKEELMKELEQDYISGLTLSGGDPLYPNNRHAIGELVKEVKTRFPNKTIWLYTGFTWDQIKGLDSLSNIDIIVDGKFVKEKADPKLHWKGSSNQHIIDVKESLSQNREVLYLE